VINAIAIGYRRLSTAIDGYRRLSTAIGYRRLSTAIGYRRLPEARFFLAQLVEKIEKNQFR
jgi:hypothetical protein